MVLAAGVVLSAAILLNTTIGVTIQSWGSFTVYATSYLRRSTPGIRYEDTAWVTAITGGMVGFTSYLGGWMLERYGPRWTSLAGGIVLSSGILASAETIRQGFLPFLTSYAVVVGLGCGIIYPAPLQVAMRWLPQRPGLVTGFIQCASGVGSMLMVIFQTWIINPENVRPATTLRSSDPYILDDSVLDRVPYALLCVAMAVFIAFIIGSSLMVEPSKDDNHELVAEGSERPLVADDSSRYTPSEVILSREFRLMWTCYLLNMLSVNFVTNHIKVIGQKANSEMTDHQLTFIVSLAALFNGFGRLAWGLLADKWSFRVAIIGMSGIKAITIATLFVSAQSGFYVYLFSVSLIFMCVGGASSIWAGAVKLYFGDKHFGRNFGLMTFAGGLGWILGAAGFQSAHKLTSDPNVAMISTGFSAAALCCGYALRDSNVFLQEEGKIAPSEKSAYGT